MIRHRQRLLPGPLSTWLAHYDGARLEPMPSRASIQLDSLARKSTDDRRSFTHRVQPERNGGLMTMGVKLEAAEQIAAGMSHMHSREAPTAFPPLDKALKTSREPDALLLAHGRRADPS